MLRTELSVADILKEEKRLEEDICKFEKATKEKRLSTLDIFTELRKKEIEIDFIELEHEHREADIKRSAIYIKKMRYILACLREEFDEPDNAKTVEVFKNTKPENALTESCHNEFVNQTELARARKMTQRLCFRNFPKASQAQRKTIFNSMDGSGRHYPFMRREFPDYTINTLEASATMLEYAAKVNGMPKENQFCKEVQKFDFDPWENKVSLWLCWWNFCHLTRGDTYRFLGNMMRTLRCPHVPGVRYKDGYHAGFILVAEPTGPKFERNNHLG